MITFRKTIDNDNLKKGHNDELLKVKFTDKHILNDSSHQIYFTQMANTLYPCEFMLTHIYLTE